MAKALTKFMERHTDATMDDAKDNFVMLSFKAKDRISVISVSV